MAQKSRKSSGRFWQRTFALSDSTLETKAARPKSQSALLALASGEITARNDKMHVKEIWRYPVKSMAGERLSGVQIDKLGVAGDRKVLVRGGNGHVVTSRTHHQLLGLKGTLGADGQPQISGHVWDSPEALALVRKAVGADAELFYSDGPERFDVLPLLVATDGAISYMGLDSRRLRPNIIVGGVEGLQEREWPGHRFRIGEAVIHAAQLRGRCVMRSEEHTSELQSRLHLVCRLLLEKKKNHSSGGLWCSLDRTCSWNAVAHC